MKPKPIDNYICPKCAEHFDKKSSKFCSNCFGCSGCEQYVCPHCGEYIVVTPPKPYQSRVDIKE